MENKQTCPTKIGTKQRSSSNEATESDNISLKSESKHDVKMSTRQVIDSINLAVTQSQRIDVLTKASVVFKHNNERTHDSEIKMGATNALCLKLGYVLFQSHGEMMDTTTTTTTDVTTGVNTETGGINNNSNNNANWHEISMICGILNIIYSGCSDTARVASFEQIGMSELVPLLVKVIERYYRLRSTTASTISVRTTTTTTTLGSNDDMCYNAAVSFLQVMRSFAKLSVSKTSLVRWGNGKLLTVLVGLLEKMTMTTSQSKSSGSLLQEGREAKENIPMEIKLSTSTTTPTPRTYTFTKMETECIGLLKDMTFRTSSDNKEYIFRHPHLIDTLVQISFTTSPSPPHPKQTQPINPTIPTSTTPQLPPLSDPIDTISTLIPIICPYEQKCHEYTAAIIWNLAIHDALKSSITTSHPRLLDAIITLLTSPKITCIKTKKNAISALGNIATVDENRYRLAVHGSERAGPSIILRTLLAVLRDNGNDYQSHSHHHSIALRRRAARTLRCITTGGSGSNNSGTTTTTETNDEETTTTSVAVVAARTENLLPVLIRTMLDDDDRETRVQTAEALASIAFDITSVRRGEEEECYGEVVKAVVDVSNSSNDEVVLEVVMARALLHLVNAVVSSSSSADSETKGVVESERSDMVGSGGNGGGGGGAQSSVVSFIENYPGSLQALARIPFVRTTNVKVKEQLAKVIRTMTETNNDVVVEKLVTCPKLLDALAALTALNGATTTTSTPITSSSPSLLLATTSGAVGVVASYEKNIRREAALAIVNLSSKTRRRKIMAEHDSLLTSLVTFVLLCADGTGGGADEDDDDVKETKQCVKDTILKLVPEL